MSGRLIWAVIALALALGGCKGVGRPLVGINGGETQGMKQCPGTVPDCSNDPLPEPPQDLPLTAAPVALSACSGPLPQIDCAGAEIAGDGACEPATVPLDLDGQGEQALSEVVCGSVRMRDRRSAPALRVLHVIGARLQSANVTIESELPLRVELAAASLQGVWFELRGPITLRIEDSQLFEDVRVSSAGDGQAAIELDSVRGARFSAAGSAPLLDEGAEVPAFTGAVAIWRSDLKKLRIDAQSLALESDAIVDMDVRVNDFQATDSALQRFTVDALHNQLAACTIDAGDFGECETFSALTGLVRGSRIESCERGVRLYGLDFRKGSIEGALVLDQTSLVETRLGLFEPTPIQAWDAHLTGVRFCQHAPTISFGGMNTVDCTQCDASLGPCGIGVCVLATGLLEVSGGSETSMDFAVAAASPGMSPACQVPAPLRMRPPRF